MTHQVAVAEATEGAESGSSVSSGATYDRRCSQATAWTFERNHSMAASTTELQRDDSDAQAHVSGGTENTADPINPTGSSAEDHELVSWVQSLPANTQESKSTIRRAVRSSAASPRSNRQHGGLLGSPLQLEESSSGRDHKSLEAESNNEAVMRKKVMLHRS